ncbi:helix-turn-helix transcriptional regulator [Maribacter sp.]|nr:helix-turn-helix transcriptional regulator [Maribacter sp.]
MNELKKGEFFGKHYKKSTFENMIITDTEYTHERVDWHYHENPYFTYLLQGKLYEANKKEDYYLEPGSLLFHNWQDAHQNIKAPEFTRGFHVELNADWFKKNEVATTALEGSLQLKNPLLKKLMNAIFLESRIADPHSQTSINLLLLEVMNTMKHQETLRTLKKPKWVDDLNALILETNSSYSLTELGQRLGIHPVHLSREFHKYFGTTFGQYIRHLRLNKAVLLMTAKRYSLTEICYTCGFYDQSHFISTFKSAYGITPSIFLKRTS